MITLRVLMARNNSDVDSLAAGDYFQFPITRVDNPAT